MKRELFRTPSPQLNELSKWLLAVGFSIACFCVIACIIGLISLEVSEYHMSIPSLFKGFMPSIEGAMFIIILIAIALFSISIYSYQTNKDKAAIVSNPSAPASSSVSSDYQSDSHSSIDSIIFTKKAKNEGKIDTIIQSLQKSVQGRKDKTRAFVQELQTWQNDGYVDAHYNARVMYDELYKLIPLSFGYEVFKKYYNNTI